MSDKLATESVEDVEEEAAERIDRRSSRSEIERAPAKRLTKHMKKYPELYRSDVSIYPSYTGLKNVPYYVTCRRRFHRDKARVLRQLNKEIAHIAMMQSFAIDSVRVDRVFSDGFPLEATVVRDFMIEEEQRRVNLLVDGRTL